MVWPLLRQSCFRSIGLVSCAPGACTGSCLVVGCLKNWQSGRKYLSRRQDSLPMQNVRARKMISEHNLNCKRNCRWL